MTEFTRITQRFFTEHLPGEKAASPHTIAAYRDTIRLLVEHVAATGGPPPADIDFPDLDADQIIEFLNWCETIRGNSPATRNSRLAAVRSLFRYASYRVVDHTDLIARVLAISPKRVSKPVVSYLTRDEAETLIGAPNPATWLGRRDKTLLHVAIHTGLRVTELTQLARSDIQLGPQPSLTCHGKGRKQRVVPLTGPSAKLLTAWLKELAATMPATQIVFPTRQGTIMTRDAIAKLVTKHARQAGTTNPAIAEKTVTPHVLRHSCAMLLRQAGIDITVIAIWLGHESTQTTDIYLHADMNIKQQALDRLNPTPANPGRYKPTDQFIAFLNRI